MSCYLQDVYFRIMFCLNFFSNCRLAMNFVYCSIRDHCHNYIAHFSGDIATPKTRHHIYTHSTPVNPSLQQTVVHHHHDNTSVNKQTREYTVARDPGEVSTRPAVDQVHHHHHYGNGDITSNLKKKKPRKKDYCNISDHEDLVRDCVHFQIDLLKTTLKTLYIYI